MRIAILSFVLGIALLQQQASLFSPMILLAMCAVAVALLWWLARNRNQFRSVYRYPILLIGCASLGWVWASAFASYYLSEELPSEWEQRDITVIGTVADLPNFFEQGARFQFEVEQILPDKGAPPTIPHHLALSWYSTNPEITQEQSIRPGQRWRFTLRLKRPHGNANPYGFDYEQWLLEQGIRATGSVQDRPKAMDNLLLQEFVWTLPHVIERSRAHLRSKINAALQGKTYAGVIVALVIGDQREISQADWQVFNRTGIGHLVSISGLHITMVAGLFAALVNYLWRRSFFIGRDLVLWLPAQKAAAVAGALMALIYVALAGFGVPSQRTLYMLTVVAVAMWSGRLTGVSHVLCLALGVTCLIDPWAVLSPGFWLSFAAVAMILWVSVGRGESPPATGWREHLQRQLAVAGRTQYAVTVGLVPLTLLLFGQVSIISPIANAVAIPLISLVVTPLALLGSVLPTPLSDLVLRLAHECVVWLALALTNLSQLSVAVWNTPTPSFASFAAAMIGTLWMLAPRGIPMRWLGLVFWLPMLTQTPLPVKVGEMRITAFDVGQGMALLVETSHHRLLYDTGPMYSPESDGGNRVIAPYLRARGIHHLDEVMISHNDADHSGGALSIFSQIEIDRTRTSLAPESPIVLAATAHQSCLAGQSWEWDGVQFQVLHPSPSVYESKKWKPNARSCTVKITNGPHSILLAGDIEAVQEDELVNSIPDQLKADVLLAPHHGSGTSSTEPFLRAVQPSIALFQVGYLNRYHHPKAEVYARYGEFGINRLRTDQTGAITLQFGTHILYSEYRRDHDRYWYGR